MSCIFRITYSVLHIPYYIFRITYSVLHIPYCVLRISFFMILICVNHANLRHLRAIFPDMTVPIEHFSSISRYNV